MPIPGIVPENAVRLGDHVPSFDIGEGSVVSTPRADVFSIEFGLTSEHTSEGFHVRQQFHKVTSEFEVTELSL